MKTAILINSLTCGGAERTVSMLINSLHEKFHDIELILLEKNEFFKIDPGIKVTYLSNLAGSENNIVKFIMLFVLARRLRNHVINNEIQCVESHLHRSNFINILAKISGSGHRSIVFIHDSVYKGDVGFIKKRINLSLVKKLYSMADQIVAVSAGLRDDIQDRFGFNNKISVIPNLFDIKMINRLSREEIYPHEFNFKRNTIYLVSVGRLYKSKRHSDLLRSFEIINKNIRGTELILIGDGPDKERLLNLSKKLNINDKVYFIGEIDNPYKYMRNCDVFIHTSAAESFGNVLVEAMICNLAVVSADCKFGPREILNASADYSNCLKDQFENGKYGILVPVGNIQVMAETVINLLRNKSLFKKYKVSGENRVLEYSKSKIIKKHIEILSLK